MKFLREIISECGRVAVIFGISVIVGAGLCAGVFAMSSLLAAVSR